MTYFTIITMLPQPLINVAFSHAKMGDVPLMIAGSDS